MVRITTASQTGRQVLCIGRNLRFNRLNLLTVAIDEHFSITQNMNRIAKHCLVCSLIFVTSVACGESIPRELRVGRAGHAFDHLGAFSDQADAAAASGATIIYATGLGGLAYSGLPPETAFATQRRAIAEYNRRAKDAGIELSIGYLCATSIVKLDTFDKNWTEAFRAQFSNPRPPSWRQQDRHGQPLASWYGGDYAPACMNNPDWRVYQRAMVQAQLESGHDGVFFDNPTVHPQGCYCEHCILKFARLLEPNESSRSSATANAIESGRLLADSRPKEFLQFRATIARDFIADMRDHARKLNPRALVTCNNSLNSPAVLYAQCRTYAYNIHELSKVEDLVVVEDMRTQPRTEANGQTVEYGPTYKQLHAISHGKPIVAVTLIRDDYHTPPNLMRLAMAEAVAHGASYLSWPTWPEKERQRMIDGVRPQAEFLRRHDAILNDVAPRADVYLFLPFRRWTETDKCVASDLAAALTQENIQYRVVCEEEFTSLFAAGRRPIVVVESWGVLTPDERSAADMAQRVGSQIVEAHASDWLQRVRAAMGEASVRVEGSSSIRAVVNDQPDCTIAHLYNLNVRPQTSFEDEVTPATNIRLELKVPFSTVRSVSIDTADKHGTCGDLQFEASRASETTRIRLTIERLDVHSMLVVKP